VNKEEGSKERTGMQRTGKVKEGKGMGWLQLVGSLKL